MKKRIAELEELKASFLQDLDATEQNQNIPNKYYKDESPSKGLDDRQINILKDELNRNNAAIQRIHDIMKKYGRKKEGGAKRKGKKNGTRKSKRRSNRRRRQTRKH